MKYIVFLVVVALLMLGPIGDSSLGLLIRLGYLVAIPYATWFLLMWIWKVWQPDAETEDRLERVLAGATGGMLLMLAVFEALADTHVGNTMYVRSYYGREAVGDDIILPGPDWTMVFLCVFFSGFAFWFSMSKRLPKMD